MSEYVAHDAELADLAVLFTGQERCAPAHGWGPAARDHWKIHAILEGRGQFQSSFGSWSLGPGQGFVIAPGEVVRYQADPSNPWHYAWVGFRGQAAASLLERAGVSVASPVFRCETDGVFAAAMATLCQSRPPHLRHPLAMVGLLFQVLAALDQEASQSVDRDASTRSATTYVRAVVDYIEANVGEKVTVAGIAAHVGLHRSYLGGLFQEATGLSIQRHLVRTRMRRACEWLRHSTLAIQEVARSVGYDDALLFSKMFRRTLGLSPSAFRRSLTADHPLDSGQIAPGSTTDQAR